MRLLATLTVRRRPPPKPAPSSFVASFALSWILVTLWASSRAAATELPTATDLVAEIWSLSTSVM